MIEGTYSLEDLSPWNLPEQSPEERQRAEKATQEHIRNVIACMRKAIEERREQFREKIDDTTRYVFCSPADYLDVATVVLTINTNITVVANQGIELGKVYFLPEFEEVMK